MGKFPSALRFMRDFMHPLLFVKYVYFESIRDAFEFEMGKSQFSDDINSPYVFTLLSRLRMFNMKQFRRREFNEILIESKEKQLR